MTALPTVPAYLRLREVVGFSHSTAKKLAEADPSFDLVGWLDVSRYDQIPIKDINDCNKNGAVR